MRRNCGNVPNYWKIVTYSGDYAKLCDNPDKFLSSHRYVTKLHYITVSNKTTGQVDERGIGFGQRPECD